MAQHLGTLAHSQCLPICYILIYYDLILFINILCSKTDLDLDVFIPVDTSSEPRCRRHRPFIQRYSRKFATDDEFFTRCTISMNFLHTSSYIDVFAPIPVFKQQLKLFLQQKTAPHYNPDHSCSWYLVRRCASCRI